MKYIDETKGSISVFLAMVLLLMLALFLMLLESARLRMLRSSTQEAADLALESVFAGYQRELYEEYGLLFYDGGFGQGFLREEELAAEYKAYFAANCGGTSVRGSFFRVNLSEPEVITLISAVDYSGEIFRRNALRSGRFQPEETQLQQTQMNLALLREGERSFPLMSEGSERFLSDQARKVLEESVAGDVLLLRASFSTAFFLPAGTAVSGASTQLDELPSLCQRDERTLYGDHVSGNNEEKAEFLEYLEQYYGSFSSQGSTGGLLYGLEYLLYGACRDDENLAYFLRRLIHARAGLNLKMILRSPQKCAELSAEAKRLYELSDEELPQETAFGYLADAWAYAEAAVDLRMLLSGRRVPLEKTEQNWTLPFSGISVLCRTGIAVTTGAEELSGLDYCSCLKLFLDEIGLEDLSYRAMDLIQIRMRGAAPGFLMCAQLDAMEFRTEVSSGPLFTALPAVQNTTGIRSGPMPLM